MEPLTAVLSQGRGSQAASSGAGSAAFIQARRDGHQDGLLKGIRSGPVDKLQRPGMDGPASLIADDVALLIHDRAPGSMADRRPFENWLIATPSIKRSVRPTILRHR